MQAACPILVPNEFFFLRQERVWKAKWANRDAKLLFCQSGHRLFFFRWGEGRLKWLGCEAGREEGGCRSPGRGRCRWSRFTGVYQSRALAKSRGENCSWGPFTSWCCGQLMPRIVVGSSELWENDDLWFRRDIEEDEVSSDCILGPDHLFLLSIHTVWHPELFCLHYLVPL